MKNQFSRFLVVGAFNTLFGYGIIFVGMYLLGFSPEGSNALGYSIGLLSSFILNRTFTFKSAGRYSGEMLRFLVVFAVAFGANLAVVYMFVRYLFVHEAVSQILAGIVYVAVSYVMNKNFVFHIKRSDQGAKI